MLFAGAPDDMKNQILSVLKFKEGKVRVRYFCVHLISRKLTLQDCKPDVDRLQELTHGHLNICSLQGDYNYCNVFCTVSKCTGQGYSYFLKELLS